MKNLFDLLEIDDNQKSPLYYKTNTLAGLMEQIITFCPKTFMYSNMTSSAESQIDMTLDTEDTEVLDSMDIIAKSTKRYATEIECIEKEEFKSK